MIELEKLNEFTESHGALRTGKGLVSGVIALTLAILCFLGVLAFHFPEYLTTPQLRKSYDVTVIRNIMLVAMAIAGGISLVNIVFNRARWLATFAFAIVAITALLGGHKVEVDPNFPDNTAAVICQTPNFFGCLEDLRGIGEIAQKQGALLITAVNPISLGVLEAPGALGADIVIGEAQSLGLPLSFGGPYIGFLATRDKWLRRTPGRIVGQTVDQDGTRGFVLTIQAREQHIRRDKATSNICSNEALCSLAVAVYLSALGKQGLRQVAELCLQKAHYARQTIAKIAGFSPVFDQPVFNEFVVRCPLSPREINEELREAGVVAGLDLGCYYPELAGCMLTAVTEKRTREEIDLLAGLLKEVSV